VLFRGKPALDRVRQNGVIEYDEKPFGPAAGRHQYKETEELLDWFPAIGVRCTRVGRCADRHGQALSEPEHQKF
jgi:hypothetical protein